MSFRTDSESPNTAPPIAPNSPARGAGQFAPTLHPQL